MEEHACMATPILIDEGVGWIPPHTWGHDGLREPWASDGGDGVAEDVVLAALDGQGVGQPQQAQLGRAVVGLPEVAVDARRWGRHDDSDRRQPRDNERNDQAPQHMHLKSSFHWCGASLYI